IEAHHFEEVQRDAVRPGHGEDRPPVALERAQPLLAQLAPRFAGLLLERHRRAARRAAARLELRLLQRPGEDVLLGERSRSSDEERDEDEQAHSSIVAHTRRMKMVPIAAAAL